MYFIKDDDRLAWFQVFSIVKLQLGEDVVQIGDIFKQTVYCWRCLWEVNQYLALVFMTGKLLGNSGFADTPCTSDKKCGCPVLILFPTQHLFIDLTSKYSFCHLFYLIRCKDSYKIPITKGKEQKTPKFSKVFCGKTPKFSNEYAVYMPKFSMCTNQTIHSPDLLHSLISIKM